MARGKYAAKAANRLADLDNEILQEKLAEIAGLNEKIAKLQSELEVARRPVEAEILRRARAIAKPEVELLRDDLANVRAEHVKDKEGIAQWIATYIRHLCETTTDEVDVIPTDIIAALTHLVGNKNVGKYTSLFLSAGRPEFASRAHRRQTAKTLARSTNQHVQDLALDGHLLLADHLKPGADMQPTRMSERLDVKETD